MPITAPQTLLIPDRLCGAPLGVYGRVRAKVYIRMFYVSRPASEVTDFEVTNTEVQHFSGPLGGPVGPVLPFKYGSLIVSEELALTDEVNLKGIPPEFLIESSLLPETYLNVSIARQLEHCLSPHNYQVTTQSVENKLLPYNLYFKSRPDIVIDKKASEGSPITVSVEQQQPASDTESVIQKERREQIW